MQVWAVELPVLPTRYRLADHLLALNEELGRVRVVLESAVSYHDEVAVAAASQRG